MFVPNVPAQLTSMTGSFDATGMRIPGATTNIMVGLVKLQHGIKLSAQDGDGSATRGASEESIITARVLVPPSVSLNRGDKITVSGMNLRIESIWPEYDTGGRFDHWRADASEMP
jgi:hypothetical protein